MTYHGTDIRGRWNYRERYWKDADFISVTSPDLLIGAPNRAHYIPFSIDRELFTAKTNPMWGAALHIEYDRWPQDKVEPIIEEMKRWVRIKWIYQVKRSEFKIPHYMMPRVLEMFEYYIDIKQLIGGELGTELSKTALEMLAMGGVVFMKNRKVTHLPGRYDPELIARTWKEVYEEFL